MEVKNVFYKAKLFIFSFKFLNSESDIKYPKFLIWDYVANKCTILQEFRKRRHQLAKCRKINVNV
jgi:hypothetical protein